MTLRLPSLTPLLLLLGLAGCGGSGTIAPSSPPQLGPGVSFHGAVQGRQQAMVGASVQLYAAGGSSSSALLTSTVTTNANGGFTVPAGYTCPSATSVLYLLAKGGRPASVAQENSAAWLMAPVGPCGNIAANTVVVLNEVTTVASAWALAQFLSPGGNLGASSGNAQGLANAVLTVNNLANMSTGVSPGAGVPSTVTVATSKLNTLANALSSCIALNGGSGCSTLFAAATVGSTGPENTLDVALNIVRNPANNVADVYAIAAADALFQPALSSAPPDWLLFNTIKGGGMNTPATVSIASSGNVWVSSYNNVVSEFSPDGAAVSNTGFSGNGINESYGMALDIHDNIWVANEQTSMGGGLGDITELTSSGQPLSPGGGFTAGGIWFPVAIAADPNGNIWIADNGHTVTLLSSNGASLSGSSGFTAPSFDFPDAIAVDANHNAWVGNQFDSLLTRISSDGSQSTSIACCDGTTGIAVDQSGNVWTANYYGNSVSLITDTSAASPSVSTFSGGGIYRPHSIAVDGGVSIWVVSDQSGSLSELAGSNSASPGMFLSSAVGFGTDAGLLGPYALAIDGSGNLWISNADDSVLTEFVGAAVPVKTPLAGPVTLP